MEKKQNAKIKTLTEALDIINNIRFKLEQSESALASDLCEASLTLHEICKILEGSKTVAMKQTPVEDTVEDLDHIEKPKDGKFVEMCRSVKGVKTKEVQSEAFANLPDDVKKSARERKLAVARDMGMTVNGGNVCYFGKQTVWDAYQERCKDIDRELAEKHIIYHTGEQVKRLFDLSMAYIGTLEKKYGYVPYSFKHNASGTIRRDKCAVRSVGYLYRINGETDQDVVKRIASNVAWYIACYALGKSPKQFYEWYDKQQVRFA